MPASRAAAVDRPQAVATLHVTNGDSAGHTLEECDLGGELVCWRDILTEGPVPAVAPQRLRALRARFLSERGWGAVGALEAEFRERDETLAHALAAGRHVVLWFEHDLYDQLQLLQVLAQVAEAGGDLARVELINVGAFEGRPDLHGLGELTAAELQSLWPARRPLEAEALAVAGDAWDAFREPDPTAIAIALERDNEGRGDERLPPAPRDGGPLPFLGDALRRLLEELPDARTGLSRGERHTLEALRDGAGTPLEVFLAVQELEEAPFEGDAWAFARIARLAGGDRPLVAGAQGRPLPAPPPRGDERAFARAPVAITEAGRAVLAGEADAVGVLGIDRCLGGTHLLPDRVWRWDAGAGRVVAP